MSLVNKPDYEVFASNARDGEVLPIPNILRGWGETILLTERIPPMEWFNWLAKRQDEWLLYLTQQGIAEWSEKVTYPIAAITKFNGLFYVSLKETKGDKPANTQTAWKLLTEYFNIDGKLDKSAVVQTTGQSTAQVMSQKAITDSLGKKLNITDLPVNTAALKGNGSWTCADTGLTIKWGESTDLEVNFDNPFPNQCLFVFLSPMQNRNVALFDSELFVSSKNKNGFTISSGKGYNRAYLAIGY